MERQVIVLLQIKLRIEKLAGLEDTRSLVKEYQQLLRRAPVKGKNTQATTRGPRVVPLGEDRWEKL